MDHGRAETCTEPVDSPLDLPHPDLRSVEREHLHVRSPDALAKFRGVLDAHDRVAVAIVRKAMDQIDEAVLHATHPEVVDDMHKEGHRGVVHEGPSSSSEESNADAGEYPGLARL
jgi:hypothetical protein